MKTLLKSLFEKRRAWVLLAVLWIAIGHPALAQTLITNYANFPVSEVRTPSSSSNYLVITNFQTNAYIALEGDQTIPINRNVLIDGTTNGVVFDGSGGGRIFTVAAKCHLILNNVQVINGSSTAGGAIFNNGALIISNCIIAGNSATNFTGTDGTTNTGGGDGGDASSGASAEGGAIYSTGPVSIYYSVLGTNSALGGNGGVGGPGGNSLLFGGNGGNGGSGGNATGAAVYSTGSPNIFVFTEFFNNACTAGAGGSGASPGTGAFAGIGGSGASGGFAAGGAVYAMGSVFVTNCVFAGNTVTAGASGADETGENSGYNGGSAEGGGLCIPEATQAYLENSVFFQNVCRAGAGGSSTGSGDDGGAGGSAVGGGLATAAALTTVRFCTLATNNLAPGAGGAGPSGAGSVGNTIGWDICALSGAINMRGSILSGGTNANPNPNPRPNASGVSDAGYNISTDDSLTPAAAGTRINNMSLLLDTLVAGFGNIIVGPTNVAGPPFETMDIAAGSSAAGVVPGVPGLSFPAIDGVGLPRGTPTSVGAYDLDSVTLDTNASAPTVNIDSATNAFTDNGGSVTFTVDATSNDTNDNNIGYQWQFNGKDLANNSTFAGATSPSLTISHVTAADQGDYQVIVGVSTLEGVADVTGFTLVITNKVRITVQPVSKRNVPVGSEVTFSVRDTGSPPVTYQWYMDSTPLTDTNEISGSTTSNLTINPATPADAGQYYVVVANDYGTATSASAILSINSQDKVKPTVAFTSPIAGRRTNNLVITGTASDNAQVTNVLYWVTNVNNGNITTNSGSASLATTGPMSKKWTITNAFLPGTNHVTVQSVDYSGNLSALATREFFYQVTSNLNLTLIPPVGAGTVTGVPSVPGGATPANGASLYIGEAYRLTAKPAKDWELENWMVGGDIVSTKPTLTFIMESNTAVTANFIATPEKTRPSVAIKSPKANSRSTAPVLSGTASDQVAVVSVAYWITNVNNGVITPQNGLAVLNGTDWSITNAILPGTNILAVQSSNGAGLVSAVARETFFYEAPTPLSLVVVPLFGTGWITGTAVSDEADLNIGQAYKLTAKPPKNFVFLNWMMGTNILSTKLTVTFIMESNFAVTANFTNTGVAVAQP